MPATEQTWRNLPRMHRIFAISSVLLLLTTIWVLWKDHRREWKNSQRQTVAIDTTMIDWRKLQFLTDTATVSHENKAEQLLLARAAVIDPQLLSRFEAEVKHFETELKKLIPADSETLPFDLPALQNDLTEQAKLAAKVQESLAASEKARQALEESRTIYLKEQAAANKDADEKVQQLKKAFQAAEEAAVKAQNAVTIAAEAAAAKRDKFVEKLSAPVNHLRAREDLVLGLRKFKSAELDKAKADIDIGVRDNYNKKQMQEKQAVVESKTAEYAALNLRYQARNTARVAMQKIVADMTAAQLNAAKENQDALADLKRLDSQYASRQQTYFVSTFPYLGKAILNLPILSAFGAPQKVENLWSEGLLQDVNFKKVRRFDRCTTCHQLLNSSLPNAPEDPAYIHESMLTFWVMPPESKEDSSTDTFKQLEKTYGLRLADKGLINANDVTVSLVLPNTPAAKAEIAEHGKREATATAQELREAVATFSGDEEKPNLHKLVPGLAPGDVIVSVGDDINLPAGRVASLLLDAVGSKQPIRLEVRRGLPNPFLTHPRLDLFVSDSSPHPMGTFGCTICHEGQGNATDFKWASHMPNDDAHDPNQSERWARQNGWFDNHHWIYPMYPKRFAESACLKCHHEVTELEPSEKFADNSAPKLTHGFHLIRKYGCYGCHEVNGYDGPTKRIGPDLRLEPNFFAVGLQLGHLLPQRLSEVEETLAKATEEHKSALQQNLETIKKALNLSIAIGTQNYNHEARRELILVFQQDQALDANQTPRAFSAELDNYAGMLKDAESPGNLRKPGPSLRYSKSKLDNAFIYDWTANPKNFRSTTRMPRFFGLWEHMQDDPAALHKAKNLEPVELHGIVAYLQSSSQTFVPVEKPANIAPVNSDEDKELQISRGKQLFETRGCLACHEHQDFQKDVVSSIDEDVTFPSAHKFRGKNEIVQGPDLSRIAAKFDPERNPQGKEWLYSWIKEPTRYHARTLMPNLFLDPIPSKDSEGKVTFTDPAEDIVAYLVSTEHLKEAGDWKIDNNATAKVDSAALKELMQEYLRESFPERKLEEYYEQGVPESMRNSIKVAERDLIVPPGQKLTEQQRLQYIGRRTIAKYGCYGCHDVPGFEDAKPIGTGLADWGRKDPAKLAFEHIGHFLSHGSHDHVSHEAKSSNEGHAPTEHENAASESEEKMPVFYQRALEHGNRTGFIYQKLRQPRSYDYKKVANKKYNDRLRMPKFPFSEEEREAVISFVLGLVADPPTDKYLYKPTPQKAAIIAGKQVLETYNCGGCHVIAGEKLNLSFAPETFGDPTDPKTYDFMLHAFDPAYLKKSAKLDNRGNVSASVTGLPAATSGLGVPLVLDDESAEVESDTNYKKSSVIYGFDLFSPVALAGKTFLPGKGSLKIPASNIVARYPTEGGFLVKYLQPIVTDRYAAAGTKNKGAESLGYLPPPLIGEGEKVQANWLHSFLLEPYPIRPAAVLRMPKFNMSSDDATKIVNYFNAVAGDSAPFTAVKERNSDYLAAAQSKYEAIAGKDNKRSDRLSDALKFVANGKEGCAQCHIIGDYIPTGVNELQGPNLGGPNLAKIYERLRPEYVRRWVADPKMILPYTAMPQLIDPKASKIPQDVIHGTSSEQLNSIVDLLMNYDTYMKQQTLIAPRISSATPEATTPTENAPKPE